MIINNGDKLVTTKKTPLLNEGDVIKVTDVNEETGLISFVFGDEYEGKGIMTFPMCEECFAKLTEDKNESTPLITLERIKEIMSNSKITVQTAFDKCTIVACQLPNGFIIVESSACVSPENYDEDKGIDICLDKIADKIWELEGYKLQNKLITDKSIKAEDCSFTYSCDCCECNNYDCEDYGEDEEFDECLDTDLDCDDCEDYDCPFNNNK